MNIHMERDEKNARYVYTITVSDQYIVAECEPYGNQELCSLITQEQAIGIITDAILMAMHLKESKQS